MSILKNQIKLHPFTAPTADTITAGAGIGNTGTADTGTAGKEGGETLKLPSLTALRTFANVIDIWDDFINGIEPHFTTLIDDDQFDENERINAEYSHFLGLIDVLDEIGDDTQRETILTAIQCQAYDVAERMADEYPVLRPFFNYYMKSEVD